MAITIAITVAVTSKVATHVKTEATVNSAVTLSGGTNFGVGGTFTINAAGSLTASAATASVLTFTDATWVDSGTFTAGASTVAFAGGAVTLPLAAETFNDLQIDATVSATAAANYIVTGDWISNHNTFVPGAFTVTFQGPKNSGNESRILGSAAATFNQLTIPSGFELVIDNADDVTVDTLTLASGGELTLSGNATLRAPAPAGSTRGASACATVAGSGRSATGAGNGTSSGPISIARSQLSARPGKPS